MIRNIPDGWRVEKLGDISKIQAGGTPSRNKPEYWNGDIPWIKISDVKSKFTTKATEFITEDGLNNSSAKLFEVDTILYTIFATLGEVSILKFPATTNQAISGIVVEQDDVNLHYLYNYLKSIKEKVISQGRGVAQNNINLGMLKNIDIPIPPLPQQEKIVKVLDISSALIEKQKELIEKYDLFLKSKFIEMFGDPISNPMGWNVEKLGDLTQVKTGKTPSRKKLEYWNDGTVNWAKTTEVNQGILTEVEEHISDLAVKECNMIMFPKNTILIAMYGQGKTRGKVVLLGVPTTINQAFGAILKSDKFATLYLLKLLDYMYENIRDLGRGGNQENLNLDIVRGINIILPPIELQNKFASIVEKTEQIKEQETKKLEHLQTLHVSLMDKAFKGEIS
jgi:type I restriction enzyme S subunit